MTFVSMKSIAGTALALGLLVQGAVAQDMQFFRIGTGGTAGTYYPIGGLIANAISNPPGSRACEDGGSCGVPGLVAILLVYAAEILQLVRLAHLPAQRPIWSQFPYLTPRVLAIGWMGCLVGQTFYSLFDAVAMGSKPNFVWWWWLALRVCA